jgi:hypothetical protein
MKRLLLSALVCAFSYAQTAVFPGAVATDAALKVTKNGVKTALRAGAAVGDSVITVADCSAVTANMLLTISRKEIVSVTSVGSGCALTVARGFDGTSAVSHSSGAEVAQYPTAWERNSLKNEIIAMQQALGPNLANINTVATAVVSSSKNFSPQTPGGTLTGGVLQSITLAPCPSGVAATNPYHYLRISGGTGTAESVLISGGTCTSGAASGTIIVTPVNSHSGAWQISSATDGIQEAINSLLPVTGGFDTQGTGGGTVVVSCGLHLMYATLTNHSNVDLNGGGNCSELRVQGSFPVVATAKYSTRMKIHDITINVNGQSGATGLDAVAVSDSIFDTIRIIGGNGTPGIGMHVRGVDSAGIGMAASVTYCAFRHIHLEIAPNQAILVEGATPAGGSVTLNYFSDIRIAAGGSIGIEIRDYTDSNWWEYIDIASSSMTAGIALGTGHPTTSTGLGYYTFRNVTCELFTVGSPVCIAAYAINNSDFDGIWTVPGVIPYTHTAYTETTSFRRAIVSTVPFTSYSDAGGFRLGSVNDGTPFVIPRFDTTAAAGLNSNVNVQFASVGRIIGPTGAFSLGGFINPIGGKFLTIVNPTPYQMTIVNEDASSTAANRIATLTGANVVLRAGPSAATFWYDDVTVRWMLISTN